MSALETTVALPLDRAEAAATLTAKLGVDRPPLKILGACNLQLAHLALQLDPSVSLVLPCNVVIEPADGGTRIAIADPRELVSDPAFRELADDGARRLQAALDSIAKDQEEVAS